MKAIPVLHTLMTVLLFVSCTILGAQNARLKMSIAFAAEQIATFYDCVERTKSPINHQQRQEEWRYVRDYYPSGTKQIQGSPLDRLVEKVRQMCMAEIASAVIEQPTR